MFFPVNFPIFIGTPFLKNTSERLLLTRTTKGTKPCKNYISSEAVVQRCSVKKVAETCKFIKKETLTQLFSCEFSKFFKNTFLTPLDNCFWSYSYYFTILNQQKQPDTHSRLCWKILLENFVKFISTCTYK